MADDDGLCCCEYRNAQGHRTHVLECCCDCESLDSAVDNLICRGRWSDEAFDKAFSTIEDRFRVPMFRGAVKVAPDVAGPLVVVPLSLCIGALHPVLTVLMLLAYPFGLYLWYRRWKRRKGGRTRMYFAWGLVSVLQVYIVFQLCVIPMKELPPLGSENLLLTAIFAACVACMCLSKRGPGIVQPDPNHQHSEPVASTNPEDYGAIGLLMVNNFGMTGADLAAQAEEKNREMRKLQHAIPPHVVDWVDSRFTNTGYISRWCEQCNLVQPARAAHCRVCNVCVRGRDHHCVWIDCCVGAANQHWFVASIILYIASTMYGCYLTMNSLCNQVVTYSWQTWPYYCPYLYATFSAGLSTISMIYALVSTFLMTWTLLTQFNMISQDITSNEMYMAGAKGWTKHCGFYATNNVNNTGCLKNWLKFITKSRFNKKCYPGTLDEKQSENH